MTTLISLIKGVITPLAVLLNLVIGVFAAILSGIIEYFVLYELFSKIIISGETRTSAILPLVIVLILEGSKLFLHFESKCFDLRAIDKSSKQLANNMNKVKWFLVLFSFICTLFYTGNTLYHNSVTVQSSIHSAEIEAIETEYKNRIKECEDTAIKNREDKVYAAKKSWYDAQKALNAWNEMNLSSDDFIAEKIRLENAVTEARNSYNETLNDSTYLDKIKSEVENLEKEKEEKIQTIISVSSNEGDNEYIKTFLLLIFNTILQKETYPSWVYFIVIILISTAFAGVLEAVIYMSQSLISTPTTELYRIFEADHNAIHDNLTNKIEKILKVLIRSIVPFSIFIIFGLLQEITMNKFNLIVGLICCMVTVIIAVFIPDKTYVSTNPVKPMEKIEESLKKFFTTEGTAILIKGIFSASMFIVLGIFYQKEIADLTLPALSVSIGQIIGHFLKIDPKPVNFI